MISPPPIVLITVGNPDCGDDSFGQMVAEETLKLGVTGIEVVQVGNNPTLLLEAMPGRTLVIVADAINLPDRDKGTVISCDWFAPNRPDLMSERSLSSHGIPISDLIELARVLGISPPTVWLVGAVIGSTELGEKASGEVQAASTIAAQHIYELVCKLAPATT